VGLEQHHVLSPAEVIGEDQARVQAVRPAVAQGSRIIVGRLRAVPALEDQRPGRGGDAQVGGGVIVRAGARVDRRALRSLGGGQRAGHAAVIAGRPGPIAGHGRPGAVRWHQGHGWGMDQHRQWQVVRVEVPVAHLRIDEAPRLAGLQVPGDGDGFTGWQQTNHQVEDIRLRISIDPRAGDLEAERRAGIAGHPDGGCIHAQVARRACAGVGDDGRQVELAAVMVRRGHLVVDLQLRRRVDGDPLRNDVGAWAIWQGIRYDCRYPELLTVCVGDGQASGHDEPFSRGSCTRAEIAQAGGRFRFEVKGARAINAARVVDGDINR